MAMFNRLVVALGLVLALTLPGLAQALDAAQQAALAARIESFDAAMRSNDMAGVLGVVPPKMFEKIAAASNLTTDQLVAATQEQLNEAMKNVTLVSFGMDLEAAQFAALADGSPYALIPTETVMDLGEAGGKYRATSHTLGLLDDETWYLVRVEDPQQLALLKEVYPGFADVEFPTGSMEPVAE
jgi:hypothetical protein